MRATFRSPETLERPFCDEHRLPLWEWIALAVVMAVALAVRLYALERVPPVVFHDECDNLVNVYQILNGRGPGFFGLDWKPQPAASVYLLSLSMRLGMSVLTLRLPAALFSVAALLPFYLLLRKFVAVPAALLATALLATDIWYLHFSRSGWENIETCLFLMAGALCFRTGLRTGGLRSFAWAGAWSAFGAYGYFGGRVVLPTLLVGGLISLLWGRVPRRRLVIGLAVMIGTMLLLFTPQLPTVVRQWELFQHRSRAVYLLGGENQGKLPREKVALLADSFGAKLLQLFGAEIPVEGQREDRYLRVEQGALARPTVWLLGLGMCVSVLWLPETWLWWVLLLVPFALTEVLATGSLNGARGIIWAPVLYLFVGLGAQVLWQLCLRAWRPFAAVIMVAGIGLCASSSYQYFVWVQSQRTFEALQPAIPVKEFPEWQAFLLHWTATTPAFFTVDMWKDRQQRLAEDAAGEWNGARSVPGICVMPDTE